MNNENDLSTHSRHTAIIRLALLTVAIVFIGMTGRKVLLNELIDYSYNLTILPKIELCNP